MLTLLHRFAALALLLTALDALLPRGTMRRTAMMCAGFLAALCFLDALQETLQLPDGISAGSVLSATDVSAGDLSAAESVYMRQAERLGYGK